MPGFHLVFGNHVSLVSSSLPPLLCLSSSLVTWHFLCLSSYFLTLTLWKILLSYCVENTVLGACWCLLTVRLRLCVIGRNTQKKRPPPEWVLLGCVVSTCHPVRLPLTWAWCAWARFSLKTHYFSFWLNIWEGGSAYILFLPRLWIAHTVHEDKWITLLLQSVNSVDCGLSQRNWSLSRVIHLFPSPPSPAVRHLLVYMSSLHPTILPANPVLSPPKSILGCLHLGSAPAISWVCSWQEAISAEAEFQLQENRGHGLRSGL